MSSTVTLSCNELKLSVTVLMGEMSPKVGGTGGVELTPRTNRTPLTDGGDSIPLITQQFQIIVDGFPGRIIDGDVLALRRMAGLHRKRPMLPLVKVTASALEYTDRTWMIDSFEDGDDDLIERDDNERLLRKGFNIGLIEANPPEGVTTKHGTGARTVRVKKGKKGKAETLKAIAARELGSSKKWKIIARYNGRSKAGGLKVNQAIRIPPS